MVAHLFFNGRVLRGQHFVRDQVWVKNGRIVTPDEGRSSSKIIKHDLRNKIVAPGFIDIQVNGAYGADFTACPVDELESAVAHCSKELPQTGCTAYCPTLITSAPEQYHARIPRIKYTKGGSKWGASVLGIHCEGPFISMKKRGCHPPELVSVIPECESSEEASKILHKMYGEDMSNIVLMTIAPEQPGALHAIEALVGEAIVVSLGHSESTYDTGLKAIEKGASCLTHLFSAMNAFGHKEPALPGLICSKLQMEPAETKLTSLLARNREVPIYRGVSLQSENSSDVSNYGPRRLYYGLIADCVHTHPYTLRVAYNTNRHGLCLITDAMAALGLPDGEYKLGETEVVVGGSPRRALKKGTDTLAGVVASLDQCVRLFAKEAGCGLEFALTAASLHPARALGIEQYKGHLGVGADADFIILDDDVNILETWINGECAYSSNDSKSVLDIKEIVCNPHVVPGFRSFS